MSSIPPSSFKTEPAERKVQIVMNDDEIFHPQAEKIGCLLHRFSASIHECHWLGNDDLLGIDPSCTVNGAKTSGADRNVVDLSESIHDLKTNIVPAHSILGSRVAQAHDDLHIGLFFCLLRLCLFLLHLSPFYSLRNHCFRSLLLYRWRHDGGDGEIRI